MIALFLIPVYILAYAYIFLRSRRWLAALAEERGKRTLSIVLGVLLLHFAASPAMALLTPKGTVLRRVLAVSANNMLGVGLYTLLIVGCVDLVRLILRLVKGRWVLHGRRPHVIIGGVCLALITAITVGGAVNAAFLRVTPYEVTVDKGAGTLAALQVVLAADLHMGYNVGRWRIRQMVDKINAQEPDIVILAGDIFDNDYDALDDPEELAELLGGIRAEYGVWAVYGNHDVVEPALGGFTFGGKESKESDPRMDGFLERANIRLLWEEWVVIDDSFILAGRADATRPGRGVTERKSPAELLAGCDRSLPILVADHQPKELHELAAAGADVDLGGHTHDGQLFPGNLLVRLLWENPWGWRNVDGMHSIVTSGVGLYGPNMRVGTTPEICSITVRFR